VLNGNAQTHVVQELNRHLDVGWLASNDNQSLTLSTARGAVSACPRFHDLDLAGTHVANLVDLASTLANNAAN